MLLRYEPNSAAASRLRLGSASRYAAKRTHFAPNRGEGRAHFAERTRHVPSRGTRITRRSQSLILSNMKNVPNRSAGALCETKPICVMRGGGPFWARGLNVTEHTSARARRVRQITRKTRAKAWVIELRTYFPVTCGLHETLGGPLSAP